MTRSFSLSSPSAASTLTITFLTMKIIGLLALLGSVASQDVGKSHSAYEVPLFTPGELRSGRSEALLTEILSTTGLLALQLPLPSATRTAALEGLCECSTRDAFKTLEGADSILLGDGQTVRSSLATATVGNSPLPLSDQLPTVCGAQVAQEMDLLRDQVAEASAVFLQVLDKLLAEAEDGEEGDGVLLQNSYGGTYKSVSAIVQAASNLEHFHVYSNHASTDNQATQKPALQMHTDAGLFLAFVPATRCGGGIQTDASFYIQNAHGAVQRAIFPSNSVAIMLGAGAETWIQTSLRLRATRHSVQMMEEAGSRAWYGMMHLVPESAIVQKSPQRTFAEMRQAMILKSQSKSTRTFADDPQNMASQDVSIGCGFSDSDLDDVAATAYGTSTQRRRRLQHVENAGACNNVTNFYCWMSCLDIPKADQAEGYVNEGYSLYCVDPSIVASTGRVSDGQAPCYEAGVLGLAMNSNCMGMWQPTAPSGVAQEVIVESSLQDAFEEPFCYGGTSMYMDGFNWVGSTCPIYLFPRFVLDSAGALVGACFFTIFFGIALEWVIQQRRVTVQKFSPGYKRLAVSASFYGVQLSMGYSIMLVVMIYSIPLFLSVVIGIVAGHVLFSAPDAVLKKKAVADTASDDTDKEKWSDVPAENCCCEGNPTADEPSEGTAMHCSSRVDNIPEYTQLSDRQKKEEANSRDLEVAEGSTPCCQHTL